MKTLLIILATWVPTVIHPIKDDATRLALQRAAREKDPVVQELARSALTPTQPASTNTTIEPPMPAELTEHPAVVLGSLSPVAAAAQRDLVEQGLAHSESVVREEAVRAAERGKLKEFVPTLLSLLDDADECLRQTIVRALRTLARQTATRETTDALVKLLDHEPSWIVAFNSCQVLVSIHDEYARDALLKFLTHQRPLVRLVGAQTLADWNDPKLAANLHPLLHDEDAVVARHAAESLGKLQNPESIAPLLARLVERPDDTVQERIAWALGELRARQAVEELSKLVVGTPNEIGGSSAMALGKIGDRQAIAILRRPLDEVDPPKTETRRQALWALRQLEDRDSIPLAWKILVQKIIPTPMGSVHDSTPVRDEALRYLAATKNKLVADNLIAVIAEPNEATTLPPVMAQTFLTIAAVGDASYAEKLLAALKSTPPAPSRPALAEALKQMTGRTYRPIPNEDHRHHFIESLGPPSYSAYPPPPGVVGAE